MEAKSFFDRLNESVIARGPLVAGLDPDVTKICDLYLHTGEATVPEFMTKGKVNSENMIFDFCTKYIDAVSDVVSAIKINSAFFESYHLESLYMTICKLAKEEGLYVIADVKRADIGNTSRQYAMAYLGEDSPIDAITINPYFGTDSVQPFLDAAIRNDKGVFVLVKTSNPTAGEFQNLVLDTGNTLYEEIAYKAGIWGDSAPYSRYSFVGAVVGATHPEEAARIRKIVPNTFFLVPGYGAQGATVEDIKICFDEEGGGAIVNASRSLMFAYERYDQYSFLEWDKATHDEAVKVQNELKEAVKDNM